MSLAITEVGHEMRSSERKIDRESAKSKLVHYAGVGRSANNIRSVFDFL